MIAGCPDGVAFEVAGVPVPQGSKTIARARSGRTWVRDDNRATLPWRNAVAAAAVEAMGDRPPLDGPVHLIVGFRFPRPRSHYRTGRRAGELRDSAPFYCATRPDLDKLIRAVGDALTGIVVVDDAQFVEVIAGKLYGPPGVRVLVRPAT